ncbi:hypothetical protein F4604DRAFT_1693941 [Suillus subluteus]|nr:hypothetical protein F4604DRAFT_1693941 [Suillus subluteus]
MSGIKAEDISNNRSSPSSQDPALMESDSSKKDKSKQSLSQSNSIYKHAPQRRRRHAGDCTCYGEKAWPTMKRLRLTPILTMTLSDAKAPGIAYTWTELRERILQGRPYITMNQIPIAICVLCDMLNFARLSLRQRTMDAVAEIKALFHIHETEEPSLDAVKGAIDTLSKLEEATDVFTAFGSSEQFSRSICNEGGIIRGSHRDIPRHSARSFEEGDQLREQGSDGLTSSLESFEHTSLQAYKCGCAHQHLVPLTPPSSFIPKSNKDKQTNNEFSITSKFMTLVPFKADSHNIEIVIAASPPGGKKAAFHKAEIRLRVHSATDGVLEIVPKQLEMRTGTSQHEFGLGIIRVNKEATTPAMPKPGQSTDSHSIHQEICHLTTERDEWKGLFLTGDQLLGGVVAFNIAPMYSQGGAITFRMEAYTRDEDPQQQDDTEESEYEDWMRIPTRKEVIGGWDETGI